MLGTTSVNISPDFSATSTLIPETSSISVAAACERSANFLTSAATTANPLPCSPALAASTAAFNANRFV